VEVAEQGAGGHMIEFYSVLIVNCDSAPGGEFCWGETIVKVEEGETKAMGIEAMEKWGWDFSDPDIHVCPYCAKGIKQEDAVSPIIRRVK